MVLKITSVVLALSWCLGASELTAAVVCAEARGEGACGMQAVYEVIWARAMSSRSSTDSVVSKRLQFSCLNHTSPKALVTTMRRTPFWAWAVALTSRPPGTTYSHGATHFTRSDEHPYWAKGRRPVAVVGRHSFYKVP